GPPRRTHGPRRPLRTAGEAAVRGRSRLVDLAGADRVAAREGLLDGLVEQGLLTILGASRLFRQLIVFLVTLQWLGPARVRRAGVVVRLLRPGLDGAVGQRPARALQHRVV